MLSEGSGTAQQSVKLTRGKNTWGCQVSTWRVFGNCEALGFSCFDREASPFTCHSRETSGCNSFFKLRFMVERSNMKHIKMSDYIGQSEENEYGFILDTSSITRDARARLRMWNGIVKLLTNIGDEWLPAPKDLAEEVQEGAETWMHFLDEGDRVRFLANPGHNYDYYVAKNGEDITGVFAVQYNKHNVLETVLEQNAVIAEQLSQCANQLVYCGTFYMRKEFRDGKIDRDLMDYAVMDLAEKGYRYLLVDEMLDQPDPNDSELYNLRFFRDHGWKETGRVMPDERRTSTEAFPHMQAERRKLEYGTVWLCKEIGH